MHDTDIASRVAEQILPERKVAKSTVSSRVLGIALASGRWEGIGSALVEFDRSRFIRALPGAVSWPRLPLTPVAVARVVDAFACGNAVDAASIDGPQGWRDPEAPADRPGVGRVCEYAARAQGKTGTRGVACPVTYLGWMQLSIGVFAELLRLRGVELVNDPAVRLQRRMRGY